MYIYGFCFLVFADQQLCSVDGASASGQIMNDADLMSSAYTTYAQSLANLGGIENHSLIDQLQSLLKSNGVQAHSSGALQRKLSADQVSTLLLSFASSLQSSVFHGSVWKYYCFWSWELKIDQIKMLIIYYQLHFWITIHFSNRVTQENIY